MPPRKASHATAERAKPPACRPQLGRWCSFTCSLKRPQHTHTHTPVEYTVAVHVVQCLHELVGVGAHTLISQVMTPTTYELIDIHVLQQHTAVTTITSNAWLLV